MDRGSYIVQETGIKIIPMQKKCTKAKWLSWEALQIAVRRREVKNKGEKERYKHLNAEFLRITRRDKKAFLSYQCKEIEENNRMGKTLMLGMIEGRKRRGQHLFGVLVLKGLVGLHGTVQLQLLQCYCLGHRLGLL